MVGNIDIEDFIKYWVDQPGSPVLDVHVNMETGLIELSQVISLLRNTGG